MFMKPLAEEFHTMKKEKLIKLSNEEKVLALVLKTKYSSNYFCSHSALTKLYTILQMITDATRVNFAFFCVLLLKVKLTQKIVMF